MYICGLECARVPGAGLGWSTGMRGGRQHGGRQHALQRSPRRSVRLWRSVLQHSRWFASVAGGKAGPLFGPSGHTRVACPPRIGSVSQFSQFRRPGCVPAPRPRASDEKA
jgi:hypothetical protein